jgi:pSer/pThr/pTyr-binding forkhead associated (FHA) protein
MRVTLTPAYCPDSVKPVSRSDCEFLVGRGNHCDMQILVPDISRSHCRIRVGDQGATVRDLESRNGTYINGRRVTGEHTLQHGDILGLGTTMLVVDIRGDDCDEAPAAEVRASLSKWGTDAATEQ